jgi:hypothetical protein
MGSIVDASEIELLLGLAGTITEQERAVCQWAIGRAESAVKRFLKYDPVRRSRTEYYPQEDVPQAGREGVWEASDTEAYVRRLSEASTDVLLVRHIPIRSSPAIELRIDYDGRSGTRAGSFGAGTVQTEGTDFWPNYDGLDADGNQICRDGMVNSEGLWPTIAGTVQIVYSGGYTQAELHGQDAVVDAGSIGEAVQDEAVRRVKKVFLTMKRTTGFVAGPFSSENLGDYSYSIGLSSGVLDKMYGDSNDLMPSSREKLSDFVNIGWVVGG